MAKNLFNSIKLTRPKNNVFDLTHDVKLSCNMGDLVPIMIQECVPGDKFHLSCESLIRFAPLVSPVMHRMDVTMHYFFVPNRVVYPDWEKFIVNDPAYIDGFPYFKLTNALYNLYPLIDYMGLPNPQPNEIKCNAIPFAAYQCIWNEYYRDQNLIPPVDYKIYGGDNSLNGNLYLMRKRAWEHDYFTASLPFAQKGAAVDIPLGMTKDSEVAFNYTVQPTTNTMKIGGSSSDVPILQELSTNPDIDPQRLYAKGTEVEPTTINDLRRAFKLQEWLERNARGGTRYIENILAHFGVKSSDKRLQRPEYICGAKAPVIISEVLNTTGESGGLPQGNMAGHGYSVNSGKNGSYFCEEHGYIIGVMSIMPKTAYQQGIPKHFLKVDDPFQYYWPTFAHLGEQEVKNAELYAKHTTPDGTFGYVPRYAEYKYMPSRVAGQFKTTLDFWHLARIFDTDPALNQDFVECKPSNRIFAVTSDGEDHMYCHILNKVKAIRPMPKFGTPMM